VIYDAVLGGVSLGLKGSVHKTNKISNIYDVATSQAEYTHVVGDIYLKRAFSAPRICTVEAGHLAREVREPAFWMRRAATVSPMRVDKLGATVAIFSSR
jgi:hypothetical protein